MPKKTIEKLIDRAEIPHYEIGFAKRLCFFSRRKNHLPDNRPVFSRDRENQLLKSL